MTTGDVTTTHGSPGRGEYMAKVQEWAEAYGDKTICDRIVVTVGNIAIALDSVGIEEAAWCWPDPDLSKVESIPYHRHANALHFQRSDNGKWYCIVLHNDPRKNAPAFALYSSDDTKGVDDPKHGVKRRRPVGWQDGDYHALLEYQDTATDMRDKIAGAP